MTVMKSYRFSLFIILSLLFVQTLSLTHAVVHPFHAEDVQTEASHHHISTSDLSHAEHAHDLTGMDHWVCELFDSVPNPAIEPATNLSWYMTTTTPPGLVVVFAISVSSASYPSHWSRGPPVA